MKSLWLGLLLFLPAPSWAKPKTVYFKSQDGWKIAALYQAPKKDKPIAVLIHGALSVKEEWNEFAEKLAGIGWGSLAIDLRGHGKSLAGPKNKKEVKNFRPMDWLSARQDLEAARTYLEKKKIPLERIGFIGASIGANLASQLAAEDSNIPWVVLLSPGLDYGGVSVARKFSHPVILGAAFEDRYAFHTCSQMLGTLDQHYFVQTRQGHGVQMFKDAGFTSKLLKLLQEL